MPMVKSVLQKLSKRTLNTTLSPDQSIAHGAAYYAGMLLTNTKHARTVFSSQASSQFSNISQQSVNARSLGIMIRDAKSGRRVPHYFIPPNSQLPVSRTRPFGTVVDNQTSVHIRIVESGAGPENPPTELGECRITNLPPRLPKSSEVEVSISYDAQARVHVSARELTTGRSVEVDFIRQENLSSQLQDSPDSTEFQSPAADDSASTQSAETAEYPESVPGREPSGLNSLVQQGHPDEDDVSHQEIVLRCSSCNSRLNSDGECESQQCLTDSQALRNWVNSSSDAEPPSDGSAENEFWNLVDES